MDIRLIVALIGVATVAASALVQFYLGRWSEKNKKMIDIRSQAYLDFLNITSEIASSAKRGEQRCLEQLQSLTQAKARIVLLGSNEVIKELNIYFSKHGSLNSDESFEAFSRIVSVMRADLSNEKLLVNSILSEGLFGNSQ